MKEFLKSILPSISRYSKSLDVKAILVDQPWVFIDDKGNYQKMIFKSDKELILSQNGKVNLGKWDYIAASNALLIDRGVDKLLLNHGFVEKGILILKYDGFSNDLFVLANENSIPNLDIQKYLESMFIELLNAVPVELNTGELFIILRKTAKESIGYKGQGVLLNYLPIPDGKYQSKKSKITYYVKDNEIIMKSIIEMIITNDNRRLEVEKFFCNETDQIGVGDVVRINGDYAPDGKYKIGLFKSIEIKNGKII